MPETAEPKAPETPEPPKPPEPEAAPAPAPAPPPAIEPAGAGASGAEIRRILVADDVNLMRNLLLRALTKAGYAVSEARHGGQVLELVARERPDLIILDSMMPVMSGPECLRRLKASPATRDIPVIMCTAKTEKRDVLEAAQGGAADYIIKPFKIETVLERVAKHLGQNPGG